MCPLPPRSLIHQMGLKLKIESLLSNVHSTHHNIPLYSKIIYTTVVIGFDTSAPKLNYHFVQRHVDGDSTE